MALINSTDYRAAGWVEPAGSSSTVYTSADYTPCPIAEGDGFGTVMEIAAQSFKWGFIYSSDGVSWTLRAMLGATAGQGEPRGVAYGAGAWVCVGASGLGAGNNLWYSSDSGFTWSPVTLPAPAGTQSYGVRYFAGAFHVATYYAGVLRVFTSSDLIAWAESMTDPLVTASSVYLGFDGARLVLTANKFGGSDIHIYSSDGLTWETHTLKTGVSIRSAVAGVGGMACAATYNGATNYIETSQYPYTSWGVKYTTASNPRGVVFDGARYILATSPLSYTVNDFLTIKTLSNPAGYGGAYTPPTLTNDLRVLAGSQFGDLALYTFDAYTTGDLVTHEGAVWQSEIDSNLIEPSDTAAEWAFQGPEAYGARTGDLFKHYLPRAKAWLLTYAKNLTNYLRGIHNTIADALIDEIDRTYYDQFAPTTRQGARWDGAEGLLPVTGERSRLAARFRARGGQSPKYIQETLQGAGFSVYVHEWWDPYTGDTRDPRVVLAAFTGNIYAQQMGRLTAQFGPTTTQFGQIASAQGYPIVNQPTNNTYGIPSDPNTHPYFLYFCDAIYPQPARIPAARRAEFERLLLTICPAHLWLGVIANFDDAPTEFILLETDDSLLLETGGMLGLET